MFIHSLIATHSTSMEDGIEILTGPSTKTAWLSPKRVHSTVKSISSSKRKGTVSRLTQPILSNERAYQIDRHVAVSAGTEENGRQTLFPTDMTEAGSLVTCPPLPCNPMLLRPLLISTPTATGPSIHLHHHGHRRQHETPSISMVRQERAYTVQILGKIHRFCPWLQ